MFKKLALSLLAIILILQIAVPTPAIAGNIESAITTMNSLRRPFNPDDWCHIFSGDSCPGTTVPTEPTQPTTEAPEPTTEAPEPTTEAPEPTTEAPEPTTEASEPTTEASEPTTEATEPTTVPATTLPPIIDIDVEPVLEIQGFHALGGQLSGISRLMVQETNVEIGGALRYQITVRNPNNVAIHDFLIVNPLNLDLVEFVPGSARINNVAVASSDYSFNPTTGLLHIYLPELSANNAYVINFEVIVLSGGSSDEISQIAHLYGPEDANGARAFIGSVNATISVIRTESEPTTAPGSTEATGPEGTIPGSTEATGPEGTTPGSTEATGPEGTTPGSTEATGPEGTTPDITDNGTGGGSGNNVGGGNNNNLLPQTGATAVAGIALAGAGTSFIGAGTALLAKKKKD